jgi:hypothetical protein
MAVYRMKKPPKVDRNAKLSNARANDSLILGLRWLI